MSDIYLQITETPTVVTLSAPVISGALTSTVTVANVVTVALDSNSLSALENVTVTVGAAITGTVTVSNFPASQAVTFSAVSISNLPSTQTIAGTVTVGTLPSIANNTDFVLVGENLAEGFNNYGVFGVSVSNLYTATQTIAGSVTLGAGTAQIGSVTASISNSVTIASLPAISGTVTANTAYATSVTGTARVGVVTAMPVALVDSGVYGGSILNYNGTNTSLNITVKGIGSTPLESATNFPVSGTVTIGSLPAISGTVTANINTFPDATTIGEQIAQGFTNYGGFDVAIAAGTAQIGSVTASISNSVTIASFATSVTARLINPAGTAVTYAEVGTAGNPSIDVLSVQGVTSGTPLTILNHQGTTVTTSNFTSTTASTTLASANTSREVLTIFNEGAGNLHICAGATCTTIAYQVRLSAGDYYEVPLNQTSLTHSAVFATAGTARIVQIS